ncbi:hypothetical protein CCYA_CCYA08G2382 [Cyanidiococcus yangmingshanensis]|nr:hypothetical protein CCYA_CCYA08G2382 [Cyanidiococcus yangmingshanensis]
MGSLVENQLDSGSLKEEGSSETQAEDGNRVCGAASRLYAACTGGVAAVVPELGQPQSVSTSETASWSEWKVRRGEVRWEDGRTPGKTAYEDAVATTPLRPCSVEDDRLPTTPISSDSDDLELASRTGPVPFDRFSKASDADTDMDPGAQLDVDEADPLVAMAVWIPKLFRTSFYSVCSAHKNAGRDSRKVNQRWVERTVFCLQCCVAVCRLCVDRQRQLECGDAAHAFHPHIGICRYMYHDVVLAKDICREMDVSRVQSYLNNGQRVMYLVRGSGSEGGAGQALTTWQSTANSGGRCRTCFRPLQHGYDFCSIFCLVTQPDDKERLHHVDTPFRRESVGEFCARAKREGRLRHVKAGNAQHRAMYERVHHGKSGPVDAGASIRAMESSSLKGRRARTVRSMPSERAGRSSAKRAQIMRASRRAQGIHRGASMNRLVAGHHRDSNRTEKDRVSGLDLESSWCNQSGSTSAERPGFLLQPSGSLGLGHQRVSAHSGESHGWNTQTDLDENALSSGDSLQSMEIRRRSLNFEARLLRFPGIRKSRRKAWPVPSVCAWNVPYSIS